MKVLELFSGTSSIGKAFKARSHEVFTVDWDKQFNPDWCGDVKELTAADILEMFGKPDIIWASPDCTTYSIAAISHHRCKDEATGNLFPVSAYAIQCDETNRHVLELISELEPLYWFIENPRGGLRKMDFMQG